jgi:hypothetical protein
MIEKSMSKKVRHRVLTSGFTKIYEWFKSYFLWDGMKQDIHNFVAKCDVFQRNKGEIE